MIEFYVKRTSILQAMRCSHAMTGLEDFSEALYQEGYARKTGQRYLCAAVHFANWLQETACHELPKEQHLGSFRNHFPCECLPGRGVCSEGLLVGARRFLAHLRVAGAEGGSVAVADPKQTSAVFRQFEDWLRRHRGVTESTIKAYGRVVLRLLDTLAHDTSAYTVAALRQFFIGETAQHGRAKARMVATAVRMFLRFLVASGLCHEELIDTFPTMPMRRLASLPRHLSAEAVERLIEACDPGTSLGARDRAIVLLLARLGLRASDVAALRLSDLNWSDSYLRVLGKGRRESLLPMPQDVGDAILHYVENARPLVEHEHVFIRYRAPHRPLASRSITSVVRYAMDRAGVEAPSRGAHILRHSAATAMLRGGASLEAISAVLRHSSIETTAWYAKVDVDLLGEVRQPWPVGVAHAG